MGLGGIKLMKQKVQLMLSINVTHNQNEKGRFKTIFLLIPRYMFAKY